MLFNLIAQAVLGALDARMFGGSMGMMIWGHGATATMQGGSAVLGSIYSLAVLLPTLAVTCRRLHDTDRSGWWQLIWIIPLIGFILMLIWTTRKGTEGPNRFGPDPISEGPSGGGDYSVTSVPRVPRGQ